MSSRSSKSRTSKSSLSTFTYFIPAPPRRSSGYREREFDKIMRGIFESGFELVEMQTQAVRTVDGGGLYVICLLKSRTKKVAGLDQNQDIHEQFTLSTRHSSPDIVLEDENEI